MLLTEQGALCKHDKLRRCELHRRLRRQGHGSGSGRCRRSHSRTAMPSIFAESTAITIFNPRYEFTPPACTIYYMRLLLSVPSRQVVILTVI
jgi:hypothetical protein